MRRASSVVVHDLDIGRTVSRPTKANSPLVIDPDRVLPLSIADQGLEPIGGRDPQVIEPLGGVKSTKLATGNSKDLNRKPLWTLTVEYRFRNFALEAPDQPPPPRDNYQG
jgi:hypothetical protein